MGKLGPTLSWELGKVLADKVLGRQMPPGQPTADTLPLAHETRLADSDLDLVRAWAADGYSGGPAVVSGVEAPAEVPDLRLLAPPRTLIPNGESDEQRCYYLPVPRPVWVRSFAWRVDRPDLTHHVGALAVDAAGAAAALALDGQDGQPGWDCPQGPAIAAVGSLGTGGNAGGHIDYPPDMAVLVPAGIVLGVHHVKSASGPVVVQDGVDLWVSAPPKYKLVDLATWAPSELPCPAGVTGPACDRTYALQHADLPYSLALAANDNALTKCGYTLASYEAQQAADTAAAGHYRVRSTCNARSSVSGRVVATHPHGHTYLTATEIRLNGRLLVGFDPYAWQWENAPILASPATIAVGDTWSITCTWDTPPDHRVIGGWRRGDEMCSGILQVAVPNL